MNQSFSVRRLVWLVAGAALCYALAVHAQDVPRGDVEEVVVTGDGGAYTVTNSRSSTKLDLSLRETPQSMTVMTRARLDDQNLQSLRDVLDNTPGVYSYQWDSERVLFTSRGFVVDGLLYDGVPAITNFNTDSVDETLDTALYDRIEIVRGATGLLTGAGSPAASVNLVRKHADSTVFDFATSVTAATWDDVRIEADLSTPLNGSGSVRARLVGVYSERDSYQALYHNERAVFYAIVDADLGPSTSVSVGYDAQRYRPDSNTWGSFPLFLGDGSLAGWPRSVTTSTDWAFWNKDKETVFAELRHTFANDWSVQATVTVRAADEDMALFYMFGFPDSVTGEGLDPYAFRNIGKADEQMADVYASGRFSWFGRQHLAVVGVNASKADLDQIEFTPGTYAPTGNFFEWDGSYPSPGFDPLGYVAADINTRQRALYAATRLSITEPLTVIAGVRSATWDTDYWYFYDSPDEGYHHDYSATIPYAGIVYDVSRGFSAFVSVTEIFKPQNSRDVNNRYLDPIEGSSVDFGVKGEHFGGRLNTALTLFKTRQDNVAEPVFDDAGAPVLLPDLTQASQPIDGTRSEGFEIEASGELRPGWSASLGWSRYMLQDAAGEAVKSYIPRTVVRLFTKWTPRSQNRFSFGGGINWQSESNTFVFSPSGGQDFVQGDVLLLSLMARYQMTPTMSLQFNGENLLDERFYVLDNYDNTYYGAPMNYSVGFNMRF